MMLKSYKFFVFILLFLANVGPVWSGEQKDEKEFWDNYKMLVERNIFSRNRGSSFDRDSSKAKKITPPKPESYFVLRGIVQQNDERIAFLEDNREGKTIKARVGESIARGILKNLTLDYIEFGLDANTTRIVIGSNLEGKLSSPALTYDDLLEWTETSSEAPNSVTSGEGKDQQNEDEDILRRLMERRKKELGE